MVIIYAVGQHLDDEVRSLTVSRLIMLTHRFHSRQQTSAALQGCQSHDRPHDIPLNSTTRCPRHRPHSGRWQSSEESRSPFQTFITDKLDAQVQGVVAHSITSQRALNSTAPRPSAAPLVPVLEYTGKLHEIKIPIDTQAGYK